MNHKLRYGFEFECASRYTHSELVRIFKKSSVADIAWGKTFAKRRQQRFGYVVVDRSIKTHKSDVRWATEIVSPMFDSRETAIFYLTQFFKLMDTLDLETNDTTGLHISMSFNNQKRMSNIDPFKLWLLDETKDNLNVWGRHGNRFCTDVHALLAFDEVWKKIKSFPSKSVIKMDDLSDVFVAELWKHASQPLRSTRWGGYAGKYHAINVINLLSTGTKPAARRVEFRHIGGKDYHTKLDIAIAQFSFFEWVMQQSACNWSVLPYLWGHRLYRRLGSDAAFTMSEDSTHIIRT